MIFHDTIVVINLYHFYEVMHALEIIKIWFIWIRTKHSIICCYYETQTKERENILIFLWVPNFSYSQSIQKHAWFFMGNYLIIWLWYFNYFVAKFYYNSIHPNYNINERADTCTLFHILFTKPIFALENYYKLMIQPKREPLLIIHTQYIFQLTSWQHLHPDSVLSNKKERTLIKEQKWISVIFDTVLYVYQIVRCCYIM